MLFLTTNQGTLNLTRAEGRSKQRVEAEESNASELLSLLKEMKAEMKERGEQIREELKWRDNHLEDQIKKRENTLTAALLQRDEE